MDHINVLNMVIYMITSINAEKKSLDRPQGCSSVVRNVFGVNKVLV